MGAQSVHSFLGNAGRPALTPVDRHCLEENKFLLSVAGRPLWITVLSGFSGRPARSTVRRFQPQICYLFHNLSHFSQNPTGEHFFPFSPKILPTQNLSNSFKTHVGITPCGLDLQSQGFLTNRFQGFQDLGLGFFSTQVKILSFVQILISSS